MVSNHFDRVTRQCASWPLAWQTEWIGLMGTVRPRWKPVTQTQNAGVMTRYLKHAADYGINDLTVDGIVGWVETLQDQVSPHTVAGYLWAIWKVGRQVTNLDLQWLYDAAAAVKREATATPKKKEGRIVHSEHILQFAFETIAGALEMGPSSWKATQLYRDGLLLALGTVAPERRRGLTAIRIPDLDLQARTVTYPPDMTKSGRQAIVRSYPQIIRDLLALCANVLATL